VNFSTGFATRGALKRHNEKYHDIVEDNVSLSKSIQVARGGSDSLFDLVKSMPERSSSASLSSPPATSPEPDPPSTESINELSAAQPNYSFTVNPSAHPAAASLPARRDSQQTSSYWSVPEQTDFPSVLAHFGTNWHGVATWMSSKDHIMVHAFSFKNIYFKLFISYL